MPGGRWARRVRAVDEVVGGAEVRLVAGHAPVGCDDGGREEGADGLPGLGDHSVHGLQIAVGTVPEDFVSPVDGVAAGDVGGEVVPGRSRGLAAGQGDQESEVRYEEFECLSGVVTVHTGHVVGDYGGH